MFPHYGVHFVSFLSVVSSTFVFIYECIYYHEVWSSPRNHVVKASYITSVHIGSVYMGCFNSSWNVTSIWISHRFETLLRSFCILFVLSVLFTWVLTRRGTNLKSIWNLTAIRESESTRYASWKSHRLFINVLYSFVSSRRCEITNGTEWNILHHSGVQRALNTSYKQRKVLARFDFQIDVKFQLAPRSSI